MIIIKYGNNLSPKHCWNNFTLTQAVNIWEQNDNRMPKNAEMWLGNKKLINTNFQRGNVGWGTKINLMINGPGGDPNFGERFRRQCNKNKWCETNKWNTNDAIYYGDAVISRKLIQEMIIEAKEYSTRDKKRQKDVTNECLQIIDYIGKRIGEVDPIKL
jgi:hypothetical protein